jgi:hypothetical protein
MAIQYGRFDKAMGILMDHFKKLSFWNKCMTSNLIKMVILVKKTKLKNHVFFMPHAFNKSEHIFYQCVHWNQLEPFEKS